MTTRKPKFKYVAVVVIETSEKVTKKALKAAVEAVLPMHLVIPNALTGPTIDAARVRSVDLD